MAKPKLEPKPMKPIKAWAVVDKRGRMLDLSWKRQPLTHWWIPNTEAVRIVRVLVQEVPRG